MVARTALHVPTLVVSAGLLSSCLAQHKQSIFLTEHFTNLNSEMGATHRTNVCGIQRDIEAGTKVMKTALQGLQIAVSLPVVTEPGKPGQQYLCAKFATASHCIYFCTSESFCWSPVSIHGRSHAMTRLCLFHSLACCRFHELGKRISFRH